MASLVDAQNLERALAALSARGPAEIVTDVKNLEEKTIQLLPMLVRDRAFTDRLWDAGILDASLTYLKDYPKMVHEDPALGRFEYKGFLPWSIITFLLNVTGDDEPPNRAHKLRSAVAIAIRPLLLTMTDERHLFAGSRELWQHLHPIFFGLLFNLL